MQDGPPRAELLWETGDASRVLRERFGLDDPAAAGAWVRSVAADHWGLRVGGPARLVMSDHNALAWVTGPAGDGLVLKWCVDAARFDRLDAVAALVSELGAHGLPVSAPVCSREGAPQVRVDGASVGLQRVATGNLLDTSDLGEVSRAGTVLAELHLAMSRVEAPTEWHPDARVVSTDRVRAWFATERPGLPTEPVLLLRRLLDDLPGEPLPVQHVHGDYRSANVLCSDHHVTAVLDFEEAHLGSYVEECARSTVLLETRYHDWGPARPEVRAAFREGYLAASSMTPADQAWWDVLELWHSLAMVPAGEDPTGWRTGVRSVVDRLSPTR